MDKRKALLVAATLLLPALLGADNAEGEEFLPYLFAAFAVTWLVFFAYAFFIARKQSDLKREIDTLQSAQDEDKDSA